MCSEVHIFVLYSNIEVRDGADAESVESAPTGKTLSSSESEWEAVNYVCNSERQYDGTHALCA